MNFIKQFIVNSLKEKLLGENATVENVESYPNKTFNACLWHCNENGEYGFSQEVIELIYNHFKDEYPLPKDTIKLFERIQAVLAEYQPTTLLDYVTEIVTDIYQSENSYLVPQSDMVYIEFNHKMKDVLGIEVATNTYVPITPKTAVKEAVQLVMDGISNNNRNRASDVMDDIINEVSRFVLYKGKRL